MPQVIAASPTPTPITIPVPIPNSVPLALGRDAAIRASEGYFVLLVKLLSELTGGDIIKSILFISIVHANTEILRRMDVSSHTFAASEGTPPDEMRQPVSVYALAKGLGMPYETTRRYVARLVEEGLCIKVPGGIIAPSSVLSTPRMAILSSRHFAQIMKFVGMVNQFTTQ